MGKYNAGRFLANRLDVPSNEAAVHTAAHELLALVVPADAGELLRAVVLLLLFLQSQVPQA